MYNVLMIGVDKTSVGGMLTVVENYMASEKFCRETNLKYIATVIRANKFIKITTFLKVLPSIIQTIKRDKIDIVHVHMGEGGSVFREGFVVWLAKKMGAKTIIHMHGATIEEWYNRQNKAVRQIASYIFRLPDRMLVLGYNWLPFMERVTGDNSRNKIQVLYNAVEVKDWNPYNIQADKILFYGMLIPRKGIHDLLAAFQKIDRELPANVTLALYGDDLEGNIRQKIVNCGLQDRVQYYGWLKPEDREQCFADVMVNVLPSYNEGLPMTILESMAYGIPNIATDIAAIPEVIENGVNGFLIKKGDVGGLAEAVKRLAADSGLRHKFSDRAWKDVSEKFSLETHIQQLLQIYEQILSNENVK